MAHSLRYLIAAVLAIGAALLTPGRAASAEQAVRFTVFASRTASGLSFSPRVGQPSVRVVVYPTARSPRYEYRGPMPLRFQDAKSGVVVAEATVPPSITEALLLFVPLEPLPATGLRYQVFVLDDSSARQAPGSLALINFSGLEMSGTIDGQSVTLVTGLNPVQTIGRSAAVALRTTLNGRSYQAYAGTIELKNSERALLLLLPPFYKGSLEVQSRLLIDSPLRKTTSVLR